MDFKKNHLFVTFPALKTDCEVVWSQKLMRQKAVTLEHLVDTLNVHHTSLETFLEAFEVTVVTQKLLKFT